MPGAVTYNPSSPTFTVSNVSFYSDDQNHASQQYELAYQTLQGNGTIIAKVNSWQQWKNWANSPGQTGLMIRNTLDAGSTYAFAAYTSSSTPWLKLVRSGSTFTAYSSANGTTWTSTGSWTLSMNSTVYIGLATWAGTGVFSNVSVTTQNGGVINPTPTLNGLSAPAGLAVTAATSGTIGLSWSSVSGATGYTIERSSDGDPMDYVQIGTTSSGTTTYTDTGLLGFQRYFYRVRAQNASGVSTPSNVVNQITRANAATNLTVTSYSNTTLIVNWTDASGETGYRLERSPDGTTWSTVTTLAANMPQLHRHGPGQQHAVLLSRRESGRRWRRGHLERVQQLHPSGRGGDLEPDEQRGEPGLAFLEQRVARSAVTTFTGLRKTTAQRPWSEPSPPARRPSPTRTRPIGRYLYYVAAYNPIADGTVSSTVVAVATPASTGLAEPLGHSGLRQRGLRRRHEVFRRHVDDGRLRPGSDGLIHHFRRIPLHLSSPSMATARLSPG